MVVLVERRGRGPDDLVERGEHAPVERVAHRDGLVDGAERFEERVGRRGEGHPVAGAGEGAEAELDQLVAPVADDHLLGLQPVVAGDLLPGGTSRGARIQPQPLVDRLTDRLKHSR